MWRAWHQAGAIPPNVRLAISAGAPLPVSLEQEVFNSRGLKIHNFLGSSECGGIAYDSGNSPRTDAALAGTPMQNVNLSVNTDGCLTVQSRAVAETYWPEKSVALGGGIFQTSDLAELKRRPGFFARTVGRPDQCRRPESFAGDRRAGAAGASAGARVPGLRRAQPRCGAAGNHCCRRRRRYAANRP